MYTYLDKGLFTARNIDLKRKSKFKPHKCHKTQITDRSVFTNRTYAGFQLLAPDAYVEMDTVHSSRESKKTLLTFFFTKEKFFLAFLMNRCTKGAVRLVFDHLEKRLGTYNFLSLFEYLLTDRDKKWVIRKHWKQAWRESNEPAFIIVILWEAEKGGVEQLT